MMAADDFGRPQTMTMFADHKFLVQMSGAPGSGKSTLASRLAQSINAIVIDHDRIKSFFLENDLAFDKSAKLTYGLQWVLAEDMIKHGHSVIVDSICNYKETLDRGLELSQKHGYEYKYVECVAGGLDILEERLRSRTPMRSQRTGINQHPSDASAASHGEDPSVLFRKWIEAPHRPTKDAIVVNSALDTNQCIAHVLQEMASHQNRHRGT